MSIQDLFQKNIASVDSANSGSSKTESYDFVLTKNEKDNKFVPRVNYSSASNFSFYGSAELYYSKSIERIYNNYPYDGSKTEKLLFHLSSSQFEEWLYNNLYPKTNGYIKMSYGGWGTQSSIADGYGLPQNIEYIYSRGGMHTASAGMAGKELFKTFDKSVKYDTANNRTTTYRMNIPDGITIEFWMQKSSFDTSKTEKEVILDLWNGEASSSSDYGRFTLALTSSGESDGSNTFLVTLQSGTVGFFEQAIGNSDITTGSLEDWHHYALSFTSASSGVTSRIYVDGNLNQKATLGSTGMNEIGGLINGYIGALQTSPSGSSAAQYSGKLSASLDEFRFWKTRRTSEQIANNWNQPVGAGTNTDDSNVNLGVYYKFNEGIVGESSQDSIVLDYSGRIANGTWNGYSSGARSTDSGLVLSSLVSSEEKDPIIYSSHPDVSTLKANLIVSGSARDEDNGNMLINKFPDWLVEEDYEINKNFRYLTQIIASFLDELYLDITELKRLKFAEYYSTEFKALPFANRLILERGIDAKDILNIATILEKYEKRNADSNILENDINNIKNIIYQNIYNNIPKILKSKGTERSFRNMLRCFGVDDEIIKLNIYTNKGIQRFTDKYKVTSYNKKTIDFGNSNNFDSIVFQTSSANNSRTYIYGSDSSKNEKNNALTFEVNVLMPYKTPSNEEGYVYYGQLSSSIGGFHQAVSDSSDYTFATNNLASLQIFAVRDELDSSKAKFVLKSGDGSLELSSSLYFDVYENSLWTLATRVKPVGYPFYGSYSSEDQEYIVDFYGVRHKAGEIDDYFHLSSSVSYASGSSFMSNRKRVFVGANRTNFTGSTLQKSDVKISNCRFYLDYLDNSVLNEHNKDITIHGSNKSFEGNTAFGTNLENKRISSLETIALNWDFNKVTGSDSSGQFLTQDISSGSTDTLYGWIDEIIRREHRGLGYGFSNSDTGFLSREYMTLYKKELPEISYTADNIKIAGIEEEAFLTDKDVSDSLYALEKSMYQVISEKMLESLSSTSEMNNLFGKAIERYRMNYKNLDYAKRIFFDKVEEDPDFDKFTEYFRWIDKSIYSFVKDLIPASVAFADNIYDVVESHIFERNKVRSLLPNKFIEAQPDDHVNSIRELTYNWKFGHAPLSGDDNDHCLWQKERKERTDITQRETIREIIINDNNQAARTLVDNDGSTYEGSTYAIRRLSRVYKEGVSMVRSIHGGINYEIQKNREMIYNATTPHSPLTTDGLPKNVVLIGAGTGQGVELKTECNDVLDPNLKKKFDVKAFLGKFSNEGGPGGTFAEINDNESYSFGVKGARSLPFNIISGSINSGYNSNFYAGWRNDAYITNIHSDTTNHRNDVPMQGPFTKRWVGGHQSRHQEINRYDSSLYDPEAAAAPLNNLQNMHTRAEAYRLLLFEAGGSGDGAFGLTDPQYGLTDISGHPNDGEYPNVARQKAIYFREERTKRPVNIKNIQTTTASYSHGNYREQYEVLSVASGKEHNNPLFRSIVDTHPYLPTAIENVLPKTTNYHTLVGVSNHPSGNVFGIGESNILNNSIDTLIEGEAGRITFSLDQISSIDHSSTLQVTGGATTFLVEINDPNVAVSYPNADLILRTGSTGLAFKASGSTTGVATGVNYGVSGDTLEDKSFTISWWYYSGDNFNSSGIYLKASSPSTVHRIDFDGDIEISLYNTAGTNDTARFNDSNTQSDSGEWNHYVAFFDVDNLSTGGPRLWKNGTELTSTGYTPIGGTTPTVTGLSIELDDEVGFQDLVFWSGSLSQTDVNELYNSGSWYNPSLHSQNSKIIDWYKFGYESYWADLGYSVGDDLSEQNPSDNKFISSSFGTGNNDLRVLTNYDEDFQFVTGINPYGAAKSNSVFWNELSSSLSSSFTTGFLVSYSDDGSKADFIVQNTTTGSSTLAASETGNDFSSIVVVDGTLAIYEKGYINVTSRTNGAVQKSVLTTRFSAPGGIETMTYGFLDAYNQEKSAYNALTYRNLLVRGSGSGEDGTIRLNDHLGNRHGLLTHLSRHSGKFGADSVYGSVTSGDYVTTPSYHKIPRNTARKPTSDSSLASPSFNLDHDNFFVRSTLPRSDFQYTWITSSLGDNYSITSGKQRMFGYAPRNGIMSSSYEVHGETGYVGAITFPTASELFGE